jgi:hypothetical protein
MPGTQKNIERIVVSTVDGQPLTAGQPVRVEGLCFWRF